MRRMRLQPRYTSFQGEEEEEERGEGGSVQNRGRTDGRTDAIKLLLSHGMQHRVRSFSLVNGERSKDSGNISDKRGSGEEQHLEKEP